MKYVFFTVYAPDRAVKVKQDRLPMWYQEVEDDSANSIENKIKSKIPAHLRNRFVLEVLDNLPVDSLGILYKRVDSVWTIIHYVEKDFNKALADAQDFVGKIDFDPVDLKEYDCIACSNEPLKNGAARSITLFFLRIDNQSHEYYLAPDPRFAMSRPINLVAISNYVNEMDVTKQKYHGKTVSEVINKLAHNYAYLQAVGLQYPLRGVLE